MANQEIQLRALEPTDLDFLYEIENDQDLWYLGSITTPFSRHVLTQYLESAHLDIYTTKQLRLIVEKEGKTIGAVDLYDFDPLNRRAGIGIVIRKDERAQGHGKKALKRLLHHCKERLNMHQLYATIPSDNLASIQLFRSCNFEQCGIKKQWLLSQNEWIDAIEMQLIF